MKERSRRRFIPRIGEIFKFQSDSKLWRGVYSDIGGLLSCGAALTGTDISRLLVTHGIPNACTRLYTRNQNWHQETLNRILEQEGINVAVLEYKRRKIWIDSSLDMQDTYLDYVIKRIDSELNRYKVVRKEVATSLSPELAKVF